MILETGTLIDGKYRVVRTLGEGGVGVVYVAEHTFLQKQFALKLLRPEMAQYPEVAARFEQEARTTGRMEHDNIVRVTDFGKTPAGELYLVMELLAGRPLSDDMFHNPRVPADRALWITHNVLCGLEAAHGVGIIHRDLKPENVLLVKRPDGSEQVKLVDFGIAKLKHETSTRLTQTGTVLGTPQYMAPEQARGVADLDQRVDVHAAGVMLYEMLAGQPPYQGDNYNIVLYEILNGKPPPLTVVAPDVDPRLAAIVMKSFHPDREQRHQTATALREALTEYTESLKARAIPKSAIHSQIAPRLAAGRTAAPPKAGSAGAEGPPSLPFKLEVVPIGEADPDRLKLAEAPPRRHETEPEALPAVTDDLFKPPRDAVLSQREATLSKVLPAMKQEPEREIEAAVEKPLELGLEAVAPRNAKFTPTPQIERMRQAPPPAAQGRGGLVLALALLVGGGDGVAVWRPWAPPTPVNTSPKMVTVTLDGLPENSVVLLDGVRRFINPIEIEPAPGLHDLRIECEGFRPKSDRIPLAASLVYDAHLERRGDGLSARKPASKP